MEISQVTHPVHVLLRWDLEGSVDGVVCEVEKEGRRGMPIDEIDGVRRKRIRQVICDENRRRSIKDLSVVIL